MAICFRKSGITHPVGHMTYASRLLPGNRPLIVVETLLSLFYSYFLLIVVFSVNSVIGKELGIEISTMLKLGMYGFLHIYLI